MNKHSPSTRIDLSRFLQSQPNIFLAKVLPFSIYHRYLSMIGFCYYGIRGEERRNLSKSLQYAIEEQLDKTRFQYVLLKTYLGIFEHYAEKMVNAHKSLSEMIRYLNHHVSISGKQWIDQIKNQRKGCIFVTGHFGAVEYIPLYLASMNYRPAIILRFKTHKLKEALAGKSTSVDLELIDADSPNVIFKALNAIKEGRILITLCDEIQNWRPSGSEKMQLFGRLIPKDRTLDILYRRSKAQSCFGIIKRKKNGYNLSIHPLANGEEKTSICESAWHLLEQYVHLYPEQWYQWPGFYLDFTRYGMSVECYGN